MATVEQLPDEIATLITKNKAKSIKAKGQKKLIQWIIDMKKTVGWSLRSLLKKDFDYSETEYNSLANKVRRFEKSLAVSAEDRLKNLEGDAFGTFIENLWSEAKSIATDTLQRWYRRAIEFGYFDKDAETVRMKEFVEDACNFYVENKEIVGSYEVEILNLKAAVATFAEMSKPSVLRIMALHSYIEFTSLCTLLAVRGIPVPEAIIMEVRETVNRVILSTHPIMERSREA